MCFYNDDKILIMKLFILVLDEEIVFWLEECNKLWVKIINLIIRIYCKICFFYIRNDINNY